MSSPKATRSATSATAAQRGLGSSSRSIGSAHHQLVLGIDQGVRAGLDIDAGLDQGAQVRRGHMLVVERQHVHAAGKLEQVLEVVVVADRGVGHGGDGRDVLAFGKNTELKTQGGGGRGHHAGQLAAANDADYWKSHRSQPTENLTGTRAMRLRTSA